jgi:GntR family transcriptional regulator
MTVPPHRGQYRQVADLIRDAIERGDYPRGLALPREDELAERMNVNRATINRALSVLEAEGLTRAIRGKGTFVTAIPPIRRDAVSRYSRSEREQAGGRGAFDTEIARLGMTSRSEVRVTRATPPAAVASLLDVPADQVSTVVRSREMYANSTAVQLADSYIPLEIAEGTVLEQEDTGLGGMVSRLADLGYQESRISEEIVVRPPTPHETRFLGLTEDQRVYHVTHVGWTAAGRAVEVTLHSMPTHLWHLRYEWPVE